MSYKVCVLTGTRADYGLLRELLFRLRNNNEVKLFIIVTGSHLSAAFGDTQQEIINDGFETFARIPIPLEDDSKGGMANSTGIALCKFSEYFTSARPDILIVLGDRYEALSAVIAARMQGIPVAHISGGDVTEGAIDDAIRHSITKMSQLHFPGCEQSRKRIIQMGEQPDSVFNVGEPGVENCLKLNFLSREELAKSISFDGVLDDYCIVTFHPVTMEDNTSEIQVRELICALDEYSNLNFIITMANADAGGRTINNIWIQEAKRHNNWLVVTSLGVLRYLSAMKYSKAVIGNSSSGIVEAPSMGVPTVNIGDRQKGRMMAKSICSCQPDYRSICDALSTVLDEKYQIMSKNIESPFGDGTTSTMIEKYLLKYLRDNPLSQEKRFYDINFEQ